MLLSILSPAAVIVALLHAQELDRMRRWLEFQRLSAPAPYKSNLRETILNEKPSFEWAPWTMEFIRPKSNDQNSTNALFPVQTMTAMPELPTVPEWIKAHLWCRLAMGKNRPEAVFEIIRRHPMRCEKVAEQVTERVFLGVGVVKMRSCRWKCAMSNSDFYELDQSFMFGGWSFDVDVAYIDITCAEFRKTEVIDDFAPIDKCECPLEVVFADPIFGYHCLSDQSHSRLIFGPLPSHAFLDELKESDFPNFLDSKLTGVFWRRCRITNLLTKRNAPERPVRAIEYSPYIPFPGCKFDFEP